MPTREQFIELIEKEFSAARAAHAGGNEGRARVCARRAAGAAITWFHAAGHRTGWGTDAMRQLEHLRDDEEFPAGVREAAGRLTAKITAHFTYPFPTDPIADAALIVRHLRRCLEGDDAGAH
jgi:hypothetical protein